MKQRNIERTIEQYKKKFNGTRKGDFFKSDIDELFMLSVEEPIYLSMKTRKIVFNAICNSLEAGFMIGYRCGMREKKASK